MSGIQEHKQQKVKNQTPGMSNKILNAKTNRPIISAQTVQFYDGRNNIIDLSEQLPNATHCSIYCSTSEKKIMKKRTSSSQILNSPISNFQQHKQATGIAREYLANPRIKARIAEESERPIESNTQSTCAFASSLRSRVPTHVVIK